MTPNNAPTSLPCSSRRPWLTAVVATLGLVAGLGATCPTVGETGERCTPPPEDYSPTDVLEHGDPCNWNVDCATGLCIPDGAGGAVCSPRGIEADTCPTVLGPDFQGMVVTDCFDQLNWSCVHADPGAVDCGGAACCDRGEACTRHDDCCSDLCYDADEDGQGECVDYCTDSCEPGEACLQVLNNGTDPLMLCVPQ